MQQEKKISYGISFVTADAKDFRAALGGLVLAKLRKEHPNYDDFISLFEESTVTTTSEMIFYDFMINADQLMKLLEK